MAAVRLDVVETDAGEAVGMRDPIRSGEPDLPPWVQFLVALPDGYKPEHVAPALAKKIQTLPHALRRSLTWDQGPEMRNWKQIRLDAGIDIFFCDPHAPWQRGSNENTNGLLRQYFPKGFDFPTSPKIELDAVADELNDRPRKRLAFAKPTEEIADLLLQ